MCDSQLGCSSPLCGILPTHDHRHAAQDMGMDRPWQRTLLKRGEGHGPAVVTAMPAQILIASYATAAPLPLHPAFFNHVAHLTRAAAALQVVLLAVVHVRPASNACAALHTWLALRGAWKCCLWALGCRCACHKMSQDVAGCGWMWPGCHLCAEKPPPSRENVPNNYGTAAVARLPRNPCQNMSPVNITPHGTRRAPPPGAAQCSIASAQV